MANNSSITRVSAQSFHKPNRFSAVALRKHLLWAAPVLVALMLGAGCSDRSQPSHESAPAARAAQSKSDDIALAQAAPVATTAPGTGNGPGAGPIAGDRKVIRNANLSVESDEPKNGAHSLTVLAESLGGYVVSSEAHSHRRADQSEETSMTVVLKVPANQFAFALESIRQGSKKVLSEKTSGQDVTEEYYDIEARLRAAKTMETHLTELLTQSKTVSDALAVHKNISEIRTEIERLEGRRRLLETQSSFSTITVNLQPVQPLVAANSNNFSTAIRQAGADSVNVAAGIVTGGIRLAGVLLPVSVMIFLPLGLILRGLIRYAQRQNAKPARSA